MSIQNVSSPIIFYIPAWNLTLNEINQAAGIKQKTRSVAASKRDVMNNHSFKLAFT